MREWTTSACVVLAWSILMPLLAAADLAVSGHPAQATTTTSITQLTLAKAPVTLAKAPVTLAKAPGNPCTNTDAILASGSSAAATATATDTDTDTAENNTWTVRQGDTLSAIATAVGVPGGWQALYAVNRRAIGPNPDVIHPGIILTLPRRQAPMRYTVMPGDTLSSIAAALATPGGWQALYAANRKAIGPDPNAIRPGTVLTAGGERNSRPAARNRREASPPTHAGSSSPSAGPTTPVSEPQRARGATARTPAATGTMPNWLKDVLIAAGLLAAIAFAIEPVAVLTRRRHSDKTPRSHANARERAPARDAAARARIVFAEHERLIVTYTGQDDTVYVFTPPGEDPRAILRAARLILPEHRYEELAHHLGVPSTLPLE